MDIFNNSLYISILIVLIEFYNETRLNNYGKFFDRIYYYFNVRNIFNIISLSTIVCCFLIFNKYKLIDDLNNTILVTNYRNLNYYPMLALTLIVILFRYEKLKNEFGYQFSSRNSFLINIKYFLFRVFSFIFTFYIFKFVLKIYAYIDTFLIKNEYYVSDWLQSENLSNEILFKKGVYFSIIITIGIFFFINTGFLKINTSYKEEKSVKLDFFKYLFVSFILCFGIFLSLYSIFNAFYNINNSSFKEFMSYDNIFGILPIRIASVIILYNFSTYFYKNVLDKKMLLFIIIAIIPYNFNKLDKSLSSISNYFNKIQINDRETLYFSQISFYIINIAVSEITYINNISTVYFSILNFTILFIIDDFVIINAYSRGFERTLKWHYFRIFGANLLMFGTSLILLANYKLFAILLVYIFLSILLSLIYFKNFDKILRGLY